MTPESKDLEVQLSGFGGWTYDGVNDKRRQKGVQCPSRRVLSFHDKSYFSFHIA